MTALSYPVPLLRPGWDGQDQDDRPVCPTCRLRHAPRPEDATATQEAS
jgi:hypothetical protein